MNKAIFAIFILVAAVKACLSPISVAQTASSSHSFDTDILAIRNISIPSFQWHYDDYLQYAPAALMVGMKACGYESRSSWGRMLAGDALSAGIMAISVNSLKYSIGRLRPDATSYNSFPSGHTATAFMTASMLHMEYGRSPWLSIGGYTAAALTGVSRIMNNRHWMTDVVAGAAIGIGSTYLGYFLADLIFKDRSLNGDYDKLPFHFDPGMKHYEVNLIFGRRFILGSGGGMKNLETRPVRGGLAGISAEIPIVHDAGITAQLTASSLIWRSGQMTDMYSCLAGGYWSFCFAKILMLQTKAMAGYAWLGPSPAAEIQSGVALSCGLDLELITGNNFKVKAFAELESADLSAQAPWLNTAIVGFGTGFFW